MPRPENRERRPAAPPPLEAAAEPLDLDAAAETDADAPEEHAEAVSEIPPSASLTRLGPEGLLRLRARYAEVMTRIADRISDPARQEELKSTAERLNPDTWVTDEEVRLGLDGYEATFEELRAVVGRPRKRRRRRRNGSTAGEPPAPSEKHGGPVEPAGGGPS